MDLVRILNTIRSNASSEYKTRIPEATQDNILQVQSAMTDQSNYGVANEFMATLLNMVALQVIHTKIFENPLKPLKKGKKPLGDTVIEIYNNFLKAKQYDREGKELFERNLADTKVIMHRHNRENTYPVTVSQVDLQRAFASYENLESYIQNTIQTVYNSAELDEFILVKQLIAQAYEQNAMKVVYVDDPNESQANGEKFIKVVKTISGDMQFPNDRNNAYLQAKGNTDEEPLITFSRKSEQVLILDNATDVSLSVDVLAKIFNMTVAEFNDTKKIVIDAFPVPGMRGALVDEQFFQIYDENIFFTRWNNPLGLYDNYYLHVFQTLSYSILCNATVFMVAGDTNSDNTVSEYTVTNTLKDGVTVTNTRKTVAEGSSFTTTLKGIAEGDTVTVTMGGKTVTTEVYDSETNKISIASVTGNIVITVA